MCTTDLSVNDRESENGCHRTLEHNSQPPWSTKKLLTFCHVPSPPEQSSTVSDMIPSTQTHEPTTAFPGLHSLCFFHGTASCCGCSGLRRRSARGHAGCDEHSVSPIPLLSNIDSMYFGGHAPTPNPDFPGGNPSIPCHVFLWFRRTAFLLRSYLEPQPLAPFAGCRSYWRCHLSTYMFLCPCAYSSKFGTLMNLTRSFLSGGAITCNEAPPAAVPLHEYRQ